MRARSDWFAKQLAVGLLPDIGIVRTEHEVLTDPQRVDIWFEPSEAGRPAAAMLGLFGRIASEPCLLEPFHNVPVEGQFRDLIRKQLTLQRELVRREPERWTSPPDAWVISSGRPETAVASFGFEPRPGWPEGVYSAAPGFRLHLVVAAELPRGADSLIVRLMGARGVFREAAAELRATSVTEFPMRDKLLRLVAIKATELRVAAERSRDEEEMLMNAAELVAEYEEKLRQEGRDEGLKEGARLQIAKVRTALLARYQSRFGSVPENIRQAIEGTADADRLTQWAMLVATAAQEQVAAQIEAGARVTFSK